MKAVVLNNLSCAKWWNLFAELEKIVQKMESLSVDINDENAYIERTKLKENLANIQNKSKSTYDEIIKNFKIALNLLECKYFI